jgi:hypothetical protein
VHIANGQLWVEFPRETHRRTLNLVQDINQAPQGFSVPSIAALHQEN